MKPKYLIRTLTLAAAIATGSTAFANNELDELEMAIKAPALLKQRRPSRARLIVCWQLPRPD